MRSPIEINDRPGAVVLTYDSEGELIDKQIAQGHLVDRATVRLALALIVCAALFVAGIVAGKLI